MLALLRKQLCLLVMLQPILFVAHAQVRDTVSSAHCFSTCNHQWYPAGIMYTHVHPRKQWMFSYTWMHSTFKGVKAGNSTIPDGSIFEKYKMKPDHMTMDMHMLMVMYGISDKINLMTMLHYSNHRMQMGSRKEEIHQHHHEMVMEEKAHMMTSSGLGDIEIGLLYSLFHTSHMEGILIAGTSLPFSPWSHRLAKERLPMPYNMLVSSGTFDFLPGFNLVATAGVFNYNFQITGIIRTGQYRGYRFGNAYTMNHSIALQYLPFMSSSIRLDLTILENMKGSDSELDISAEPGADPANFGGKKAVLFLGTNFYFNKRWIRNFRFAIEGGVPVYEYLLGIQPSELSRLHATLVFII